MGNTSAVCLLASLVDPKVLRTVRQSIGGRFFFLLFFSVQVWPFGGGAHACCAHIRCFGGSIDVVPIIGSHENLGLR